MSAVPAHPSDAPQRLHAWAALLFLVFLVGQLVVTIALGPQAAVQMRSSWPSLICHAP